MIEHTVATAATGRTIVGLVAGRRVHVVLGSPARFDARRVVGRDALGYSELVAAASDVRGVLTWSSGGIHVSRHSWR